MQGDVSEIGRAQDAENAVIVLGLLNSVERDGARSQRALASELGIALGLVNAYLKRCVKKGLLKVREAPARRYAYYLTPQGFAEKSRLTVDYLSHSFSFFRQARADCTQILTTARARGVKRVVLSGISDLSDIVRLCALETGMEVVGIVARESRSDFIGLPVSRSLESVPVPFDAVIVTDMYNAGETYLLALKSCGADQVYVPKLLGLNQPDSQS